MKKIALIVAGGSGNRMNYSMPKQFIKINGIPLLIHTFKAFIRNSEGRIIGVVLNEGWDYKSPNTGIQRAIRSKKAVILATGGFGSDIPFRTAQDPRLTEEIDTTNKPSATAEALKEALRIGAMPVHLSHIQLGPWGSPDEKGYGVGSRFSDYIVFPYGIIIDPGTGRRIVNELSDRKAVSEAILNTGHPCLGIVDSQAVEQSGWNITPCLEKGIVTQFSQLQALASYHGISAGTVKLTVDKFNRCVENKIDKEFGKPILSGAAPVFSPPYFAIRLWPKVHHTMGGVQINVMGQVIGLDYQPIKGLYAAGEVAGGIHGACRLGSCAVTDCLVFGRIAGKNAATESQE